jgi:hypothetical protein
LSSSCVMSNVTSVSGFSSSCAMSNVTSVSGQDEDTPEKLVT